MRHTTLALLAIAFAMPAAPAAARQIVPRVSARDSVPRLTCPMPVAVPRGHHTMPVAPPDSTKTYTMPVAPPRCFNPLAPASKVRLEPAWSKGLLDGLDYGFRPVPKASPRRRGGNR